MLRAGLACGSLLSLLFGVAAEAPNIGELGASNPQRHKVAAELDMSIPHAILRGLHTHLDMDGDGAASLLEILGLARSMRPAVAKNEVKYTFTVYDRDGNGRLTLPELEIDLQAYGDHGPEDLEDRRAAQQQKFVVADANRDGALNREEALAFFYPAAAGGQALELETKLSLQSRDRDGDGRLSPAELWSQGEHDQLMDAEAADFQALDANSDGFLDTQELQAWESGEFHIGEAMRHLVKVADKDGDKQLSELELLEAQQEIAGSDAQHHFMEWAELLEL